MTEAFFHEQVWGRFMRLPYGHIVDYTDGEGTVFFPTAEDCNRSMPNAFGRWTPITNGAMFSGLYLSALIRKYTHTPDSKTAEEIRLMVQGLYALQDVGQVEGFIARGLSDDGTACYPMGSEDQSVPWIMALAEYLETPLCTAEEAGEIRNRLLTVLGAMRAAGWQIPMNVEGLYTNEWVKAQNWRSVCKLLYCTRLFYELTGDEQERIAYESLRDGKPEGSIYSRLEIVSQGFTPDMIYNTGLIKMWIHLDSHLGLLWLAEKDPENRAHYLHACRMNGVAALPFLKKMLDYDNDIEGFSVDWRPLATIWEPFDGTFATAIDLSNKTSKYWRVNMVPHRKMEHSVLGEALFAAWIAASCPEKRIAESAVAQLTEYSARVDWDTVHLPYAFVAEGTLIFGKTNGCNL